MKAELLLEERIVVGEAAFVEIVVWRLPKPTRGSDHEYKYRLALVENGVCTLRYDNEAGKGDHRHIGAREENYTFTGPENLLSDFWADVDARRR
jgi:hypothetical protein